MNTNLDKDRVAARNMMSFMDNVEKESASVSKKALALVLNNDGQLIFVIISILICSILSFYIGFSENTIIVMRSINDTSFTLSLGLFTIFFTGYTLFQALSNKSTIQNLLVTNSKSSSTYATYNLYFVGICYLSIILLATNFILKVFLAAVDDLFYLDCFSYSFNSSIAFILICIYLLLNLKLIMEAKSFILNIFKSILICHSSVLVENDTMNNSNTIHNRQDRN